MGKFGIAPLDGRIKQRSRSPPGPIGSLIHVTNSGFNRKGVAKSRNVKIIPESMMMVPFPTQWS